MSIAKTVSVCSSVHEVIDPRVPQSLLDAPGGRDYCLRMGLIKYVPATELEPLPEEFVAAVHSAMLKEDEAHQQARAAHAAKENAKNTLFRRMLEVVTNTGPEVVDCETGPTAICCNYCCAEIPGTSLSAAHQLQHDPECLHVLALNYKERYGNPV